MARKEIIFNKLQALGSELAQAGVARVGVFGSVVRGEETPQSDVDILIEFAPGQTKWANFNRVCDLLEAEIGTEVDIVTRGGLSPFMAPQILQEVQWVA